MSEDQRYAGVDEVTNVAAYRIRLEGSVSSVESRVVKSFRVKYPSMSNVYIRVYILPIFYPSISE